MHKQPMNTKKKRRKFLERLRQKRLEDKHYMPDRKPRREIARPTAEWRRY